MWMQSLCLCCAALKPTWRAGAALQTGQNFAPHTNWQGATRRLRASQLTCTIRPSPSKPRILHVRTSSALVEGPAPKLKRW